MPQNVNSPGRPSDIGSSHHRQADAPGYVDVTPDFHPWMDDAACLGMYEWIEADPRTTRRVCLGDPERDMPACPVLAQCRSWVLSRPPENWGVWAGMTRKQQERARTLIAKQAELDRQARVAA